MKVTKPLIWALVLLVFICAVYRIIPNRGFGFAPQWAVAIFAGAIVPNKKWAFLMPVLSMFLSDLLFQGLYLSGASSMPGFYEGQWQNYLLFAMLVFVGFGIRRPGVLNVLAASLAAPTIYFLISNFIVWAGWQGTRGYGHPKDFSGLMMTLADGIPFYQNSLIATVVFSFILFGSYELMTRSRTQIAA